MDEPEYTSPPRHWKAKLGLRAASILFMAIAGAIGGSLAVKPRVRHMDGLVPAALCPGIGGTLIWDVIEIIYILKLGGRRGINPGGVIVGEIFACIGWGLEIALFTLFIFKSTPAGLISDHSGWGPARLDFDPARVTAEDWALENQIRHGTRAMAAFMGLTFLTHFALFVFACHETRIHRRLIRERINNSIRMRRAADGQDEPPPPYTVLPDKAETKK
ncbi:hypothetical protein VTJ04DRAFT_10371 [Mycothermus thermophilus]|uniref:uncharacterized protein n=1 Tax=Humicola insolens TaxID=85995 RepID=UPI0037444F30